jgi:cyclophilin family peptidyl-prolyl cis-trans isomerase/protein-disulfide isomerase
MPKKLIDACLLLVLVLTACSPAAPQLSNHSTPTPSIPLQTQVNTPATAPVASNCTVVTSALSTLDPTQAATDSLFKPVSKDDWITGPENAAVTLIEYSDFQCPYCAALATVLDQILMEYPQDVQVVFRYFPNPLHDKAMLSAQAAEAAGMQGKFWEMSDLLFNQQSTWALMTPADFETWVNGKATDLKLDLNRFKTDMNSDGVINKLTVALNEDESLSIPGTPFILLNGKIWQGPRDLDSLETAINLLLLEKKQVIGCPPMTIDVTKQYLAHLVTDKGEIVIQLFPDKAPFTVNSFVYLARRGWYDGVTFHWVVSDQIAQTGDPSGTGYGGPGYAFKDEISPDLKFDKAGVVGMANAGPGSNGSQFFITYTALPSLDGKHTIFGQVIKGMDVVQKLTPRDPTQPGPLPAGDKIIQVTIEEK